MKSLLIIIVFVLYNCTSYNQYKYVDKNLRVKTGKWVEKDAYPDGEFISKGTYKNGNKIGSWKTKYNNKLYQKDIIYDSMIKTKIYHDNKKISKQGTSKILIKKDSYHWYMDGVWKDYDESGNLTFIKIYRDTANKIDSINCKTADCSKY